MINAIANITGIPKPMTNPKINGMLDFSGVGSGLIDSFTTKVIGTDSMDVCESLVALILNLYVPATHCSVHDNIPLLSIDNHSGLSPSDMTISHFVALNPAIVVYCSEPADFSSIFIDIFPIIPITSNRDESNPKFDAFKYFCFACSDGTYTFSLTVGCQLAPNDVGGVSDKKYKLSTVTVENTKLPIIINDFGKMISPDNF